MDDPNQVPPEPNQPPAPAKASIRVFGVGGAGIKIIEHLLAAGMPDRAFIALDSDPRSLPASSAADKLSLTLPRVAADTDTIADSSHGFVPPPVLKAALTGADLIFIVAGLGGSTGTTLSPMLARAAKEAGALTLGFVTMPFDFEGTRKKQVARDGLEELLAAADGVVCLPSQKLSKLIDGSTSFMEAFKLSNALLADAIRGIWRLRTHQGPVELHFDQLCELLRDQHTQSAFAVAEAQGPNRSAEVLEKLLAHPMLEGGQILAEAESVLVSLLGGPDLTLADVNRVMEELSSKCDGAQVSMGAAVDDSFHGHLAVTLIAARQPEVPATVPWQRGSAEPLNHQLLGQSEPKPESRFVPPPPALPPERMAQMFNRQPGTGGRGRKSGPKLRQTQLPLEIISKGRFDKSEPTIHRGEDLDVPTYIRRGVSLN
jgi:cell division protein FtsZ